VTFSNPNTYTIEKTKEKNRTLFQYQMTYEPDQNIIKRKEWSIVDLLSNLGGIWTVLFQMMGIIIIPFAEHSFVL
jgi:hypothetical protein